MADRMQHRINKIEAEQRTDVPSPKNRLVLANIMAYGDGWVMLRHKRCTPFVIAKKDLLAILREIQSEPEVPHA